MRAASEDHAFSSIWSTSNSAEALPTKLFEHRVKMLTPALGGAVGEIDADQGEMGGQDSGPDEIIERRHHKALGEVSESAEDHHDASVGGLGLMARRGGDDRRHGCVASPRSSDHLLEWLKSPLPHAKAQPIRAS